MSRKLLKGVVLSTKQPKTVAVRVSSTKIHPVYRKRFVVGKKYQVHYEGNDLKEGDSVVIVERSPVSKTKKWEIKK